MMYRCLCLIRRPVLSCIVSLVLLFFYVSIVYPKDKIKSGNIDAVIDVNATKKIMTINKNMFGVSMGKLYRAQWKKPADLNDKNLLNILNELRPGFINIQNTMLGLPFYTESTGERSKRLSVNEILKRLGVTSEPLGQELYKKVKDDKFYNKPPNKNYDDILRFFERLDLKPGICIRVPTIFTTLLDPNSYEGLDLARLSINLDPKTGADLVHYLNDPETTEFGAMRARNGHPEPYNVKHFILGNELWVNYEKGLSIEQIASQHIAFYNAMKKADPNVMIGHNLVNDAFPREYFKEGASEKHKKLLDYNDRILGLIKDHIDFVTYHDYSYGVKNKGARVDILSEDEWRYLMAYNYMKSEYGQADMHRETIQKYNSKAKVVIDEFSGPVGSLGGAIYITDYMIYLLNSGYDIFFGHWTLGLMEPHTKWGMIKVWENNDKPPVKRPNFYAMTLFTNHFGDEIIETDTTSPAFDTKLMKWERYFDWPAGKDIQALKVIGSTKGDKLYLMVINRDIKKDIRSEINLNGFVPESIARVFILNGPSMNAGNENEPDTVKISESAIKDASKSFYYTFEKHSVTVIEFSAK